MANITTYEQCSAAHPALKINVHAQVSNSLLGSGNGRSSCGLDTKALVHNPITYKYRPFIIQLPIIIGISGMNRCYPSYNLSEPLERRKKLFTAPWCYHWGYLQLPQLRQCGKNHQFMRAWPAITGTTSVDVPIWYSAGYVGSCFHIRRYCPVVLLTLGHRPCHTER